MEPNVIKIETRAKKEITVCQNLKDLDGVFRKYLGKKGEITRILRSLKDLPEGARRKQGKTANELKQALQILFDEKAAELRKKEAELPRDKQIDITAPGEKPVIGHLHPLTLIQRQVIDIFQQMGFSVATGPEVETEWYNFDALNIPEEHPARDMWNTLWLRGNQKFPISNFQFPNPIGEPSVPYGAGKSQISNYKSQKLLLRTHTSPVQIRYMEKNDPPLRIIAPGRVFRREATDASHEINFYQLEGLMVDKNVSTAHFKAIITEFFQRFFARPPAELPGGGKTDQIKIRLRPSYFPFVEPGFEVDVNCTACSKSEIRNSKSETNPKSKIQNPKPDCSVCHGAGWLEMMGAGMVHPKVFEAVRYNPRDWTGFAFGMGLDRLAMMKYKINDIRLFYGGDLRFLSQF